MKAEFVWSDGSIKAHRNTILMTSEVQRSQVRVISQLNADNTLEFHFLKKFYTWQWADTSTARASVLRAKLVQHLCAEDEKTSGLQFMSVGLSLKK